MSSLIVLISFQGGGGVGIRVGGEGFVTMHPLFIAKIDIQRQTYKMATDTIL